MNKHIYITRKIPEAGLKLLRERGITFDIGKFKIPPTKKEIIKALSKKQYDGVISFLTDPIDKEVFDSCITAKIYANFSVGYNNIDIEEAKKRNIYVSNTPGTSATAVAEHTVALMLALTTRLVEGDEFMRKGKLSANSLRFVLFKVTVWILAFVFDIMFALLRARCATTLKIKCRFVITG